jgi:hypothetical protein
MFKSTVLPEAEAIGNMLNTYISCTWLPLEATMSIFNARLPLLKPVFVRRD